MMLFSIVRKEEFITYLAAVMILAYCDCLPTFFFFFYIYLFREGSSSDHIHTVTHIHNWKLPNLICWQLIGVGVKGLAQWHFIDGNEGGVSAIFFTFPTQIFPAGLGD